MTFRVLLLPLAVLLVAAGPRAAYSIIPEGSAVTQSRTLAAKPVCALRNSARVLISGHSLTDQPLPDYLAQVAVSLGTPIRWNRQYVVGSTIEQRTRGARGARASDGWAGYRLGANRQGEGMDVLSELRTGKTIDGERYDTLLITEQNGLLYSLFNYDTVRYLRHYHERFIEANPIGQTYFYEPWNGLVDKSDPSRWIAYERAASPIWQCVATRVNISLAAEGRSDRIAAFPAGLMMAAMIERLTQGTGVHGVSGASIRETVDKFFSDNVHLTPLGSYYIALATYANVYGKSPLGAWAPKGVSPDQAKWLQQFAWDTLVQYRANNQAPSLARCRALLRDGFINHFWSYSRDSGTQRSIGPLRTHLRWLRNFIATHWQIRQKNSTNPLYYDAATDKDYWLPAP